MKSLVFVIILMVIVACQPSKPLEEKSATNYFLHKNSGIQNGGVKMIPLETERGIFNVWTKTIGNNPKTRVLLLSGGPGISHEYLECFESFLPGEGIEFIYYDQLGCGHSDNPADTSFWDLDRFVEEVEQVRKSLQLDKDNFYLLGHSWGGILAMQYALKYQQNMKGLIVSNMMSSCPDYGQYADEVLALQMDKVVLDSIRTMEAAGEYTNPKYMNLLMNHYYQQHICRILIADWPEPVNRAFAGMNQSLYVTMQGPSEFGISGKLTHWDISKRLQEILIPTLVIGAKHDTMDPEHMKWMSSQFKNGSYLFCDNGSHMCFYDDQQTYFKGLIDFLNKTK